MELIVCIYNFTLISRQNVLYFRILAFSKFLNTYFSKRLVIYGAFLKLCCQYRQYDAGDLSSFI